MRKIKMIYFPTNNRNRNVSVSVIISIMLLTCCLDEGFLFLRTYVEREFRKI